MGSQDEDSSQVGSSARGGRSSTSQGGSEIHHDFLRRGIPSRAAIATTRFLPPSCISIGGRGRSAYPANRYFSIFVMVFFPPVSLTENFTLSPACTVLNMASGALNCCSAAPPPPAPTVPSWVCWIAMVPLIRSIVVTVPVRVGPGACWAHVTELMTVSIEPAKTIFANFIEISPFFEQSTISRNKRIGSRTEP
jgi:hypothetical protein